MTSCGAPEEKTGSVSIIDREINAHLANTHIIPEPGNPVLGRGLLAVRRGEVVRLSGYLVRVEGPGGLQWNSSRARRDSGNHACEVFYVTEMD